jgi:hypothetical protein
MKLISAERRIGEIEGAPFPSVLMHFTPGSLVLLHKKTSYGLLGKGKQYIRRRPGKETRLFCPSVVLSLTLSLEKKKRSGGRIKARFKENAEKEAEKSRLYHTGCVFSPFSLSSMAEKGSEFSQTLWCVRQLRMCVENANYLLLNPIPKIFCKKKAKI